MLRKLCDKFCKIRILFRIHDILRMSFAHHGKLGANVSERVRHYNKAIRRQICAKLQIASLRNGRSSVFAAQLPSS